jgi:hypothetical protein
MALSDAELQRKLNLTSGELQQLQSVRDQARQEMGRLPLLARENLREADRRHLGYRQRWFERERPPSRKRPQGFSLPHISPPCLPLLRCYS